MFDITGDPKEYSPLRKEKRGAFGAMELLIGNVVTVRDAVTMADLLQYDK